MPARGAQDALTKRLLLDEHRPASKVAAQVACERVHACVAPRWVRIGGLRDNAVKVAAQPRIHCGEPRCDVCRNHVHGLRHGAAIKCAHRLAGEDPVGNGPEGEHVRAGICPCARIEALRGDRHEAADDPVAEHGNRPLACRAIVPGKPEVNHLGHAGAIEQHISRLEVAVDDALGVRICDRVRDISEQCDARADG